MVNSRRRPFYLDLGRIRKFTTVINAIILVLVFALAAFFVICHVTFLAWFSIPTALVYMIGFVLIKKERLDLYTRLVYFWLTFYMCLSTVCLGLGFGFHLYCLSMIPIIFYTEYMAEKSGKRTINALVTSAVISLCYLVATAYAAFGKPLYIVDTTYAGLFWIFNSATVLAFLIIYSRMMLSLITDYEGQLRNVALTDRLTGLYNRHFMITKLESSVNENLSLCVAMVDIDDFKQINDRYGHNAGDYILINVSRIMREVCSDCNISRWGGEEFLILSGDTTCPDFHSVAEALRKRVEDENFIFGEDKINVTITIGIACYKDGLSVDKWVNSADDNLYLGKNSGKNKVVS